MKGYKETVGHTGKAVWRLLIKTGETSKITFSGGWKGNEEIIIGN